jgi:hypothetical protein
VDRSQFTKQKIKEIYTASKFEIKNIKKNIDCFVSYGFDYDKNIFFEEILDLRDRSMLQKAESTESENDLQLIIKHYNIINQIEILREDIEELINKGYPVDFYLKIFILKEDVYIEIDKPNEIIITLLKEKNKSELKDKYSIREISLVIREELDNLI